MKASRPAFLWYIKSAVSTISLFSLAWLETNLTIHLLHELLPTTSRPSTIHSVYALGCPPLGHIEILGVAAVSLS